MSPPPEEMMSWLLEELGFAGAEGESVLIFAMFKEAYRYQVSASLEGLPLVA
jgi:hypothetical protein